ncbi:LysR family transcriptional regulator [Brucella tritici]|uniref:LysR family transcriptional regulator n=2 Tax=Brucella tritici TaxID=94626 RepID=UPI00178C17EF|nr:LysR family transcriptional regulator [Brucella tritici]
MVNLERSMLADLNIFVTIVRRQSIKQAANELGVTTSAISHRLRKLEADLGVRLLNRTSRSIKPTLAGKAFAEQLETGLRAIAEAVEALTSQRDFPSGRIRLNALRDAARLIIAPILPRYTQTYPDMHLDMTIDDQMVDIVAEGFDAGIRYGDRVPQDMIGVPLTGPLQWIVVGSPVLISRVGRPEAPDDLLRLPCIETRLGDNSRYAWELGNGASLRRVDVKGPICANETEQAVEAALSGIGFAYCLEPLVQNYLDTGALEAVLPDWASEGPPLTMYYPSRRQVPSGLRRLIDIIREDQGLTKLVVAEEATSP